ncbi:hypothetical protein TRAPUB_2573 [Trametes pubescens]|uniref:Uncharacterized protein n=1 Tax=Trametes pubescens TaxID=154538 RepID=A0A1M2VG76_TRAPU|nr:hypothetical protein TRAPUB_2573 [Trametes pubescens]
MPCNSPCADARSSASVDGARAALPEADTGSRNTADGGGIDTDAEEADDAGPAVPAERDREPACLLARRSRAGRIAFARSREADAGVMVRSVAALATLWDDAECVERRSLACSSLGFGVDDCEEVNGVTARGVAVRADEEDAYE